MKKNFKFSYIYGPVLSRRLGLSLGVDLLINRGLNKVCNFNCIYCQLGRTIKKTDKRFYSVDLERLKEELKEAIKKNPDIDYISISGSGEPTLHKNLDRIVLAIKEATDYKYPVCLITNASLFYKREVLKELKNIDLIIPSLDAGDSRIFKKINRPNVSFKALIRGFINLRKWFKGNIWLEIMVVDRINDTIEQAKKIKKLIDKIKPDRVQINLPIRPTPTKIKLPSKRKIDMIRKILGDNVEVVSFLNKKSKIRYYKDIKERILNYLKRRPAKLDDFKRIFNIEEKILVRKLNDLIDENKIIAKVYKNDKYFVIRND